MDPYKLKTYFVSGSRILILRLGDLAGGISQALMWHMAMPIHTHTYFPAGRRNGTL